MENVPDLIRKKHMPNFAKWLEFLETLGYKTKFGVLNTKDFGIPQNRARCFAVSVLGDYYYDMPKGFALDKKVKDFLETNVDDSYYLKDHNLAYVLDIYHKCDNTKRGDLGKRVVNPQIAKTISCRGAEAQRADITNFVIEGSDKEYTIEDMRQMIAPTNNETEYVIYDGFNQEIRADKNTVGTITRNIGADLKRNGQGIIEENGVDLKVRKFTEKECFRLQGVKDCDYENIKENQPKSSLYHLAGDSITVSVLMALFGEMLGVNWRKCVQDLVEDLKEKEYYGQKRINRQGNCKSIGDLCEGRVV